MRQIPAWWTKLLQASSYIPLWSGSPKTLRLEVKRRLHHMNWTQLNWRNYSEHVYSSRAVHTAQHTQPFNGPFSGTTRVSRYEKGKSNQDFLLKQETMSGSGISWAICKSAHCSRQTTTPTPPPLCFLQAGCPSCRPTNSVKALKARTELKWTRANQWERSQPISAKVDTTAPDCAHDQLALEVAGRVGK